MGKVLARGSSESVAIQGLNCRKHVITTLGTITRNEMSMLCSERVKSVQRTRSAQLLEEFNWRDVIEEAEEHAPS